MVDVLIGFLVKPALCRIMSFASERRAECTRKTTNCSIKTFLSIGPTKQFKSLFFGGSKTIDHHLPMVGNLEMTLNDGAFFFVRDDTIPYVVGCLAMPML